MIGDIFGKEQPTPPAAPDYAAAATAQGAANQNAAIATGVLNRPNQYSPLGSQTWDQTGSYTLPDGTAVPRFSSTTAFTPTGQNLFNKGLDLQTGLMDTGDSALRDVQSSLSKPFDISNNRDAIVDAMYRRQTRLMDPYYAQQRENNDASLISKGFSVGDVGWDRAQGNFQRGQDEAYADARDRAMTGGAQQAVSEALVSRNQPISELNAIRTGAQPQMPTFNNQTQAGGVNAAPIMAGTQAAGNAATTLYGQQSANYNNMLTGLASLGSAYLGA